MLPGIIHNRFSISSIDLKEKRFFCVHMSYMLSFMSRLQGVEPLEIELALVEMHVDIQVGHPERSQILEEMSSLTWIHRIVF